MSAIDWTAVILAAGGIYIALFFAGRWVFQMGYHGIVTETGFERVARQGSIPAWISLPIADIASRRR